jgi:hypothetical protein
MDVEENRHENFPMHYFATADRFHDQRMFWPFTKNTESPDQTKIKVNTIAVLPVDHQDADGKVAQLLRTKFSEENYFKGYSRIPLEELDKKLAMSAVDSDKKNTLLFL